MSDSFMFGSDDQESATPAAVTRNRPIGGAVVTSDEVAPAAGAANPLEVSPLAVSSLVVSLVPGDGQLVSVGGWWVAGSVGADLIRVGDRLAGISGGTAAVGLAEGRAATAQSVLRDQPSIVALMHLDDRGALAVVRPQVAVRVVYDHGVHDHRVGADTDFTVLVVDRPFVSMAMLAFAAASGAVAQPVVPAFGELRSEPMTGAGVVVTAGASALGDSATGDSAIGNSAIGNSALGGSGSDLAAAGSPDTDVPEAGRLVDAPGSAAFVAPAAVAGHGAGGRLVLDDQVWVVGDETVIGRGPFADPADVAIGDTFLDPLHAGFLLDDGAVYLSDLGSRSGTYVRNTSDTRWVRVDVDTPHRLTQSCEILLGRTTLRYLP